jgi:hypothetical protein
VTHGFPVSMESAIALFNRRAFFECHEVLEDLWRPLPPGPEKQGLQGILQIAVGLLHVQRGNFTGARNLLQSGLEKLAPLLPDPDYTAPFPLAPFIKDSEAALSQVLSMGSQGLQRFPPECFPKIRQ